MNKEHLFSLKIKIVLTNQGVGTISTKRFRVKACPRPGRRLIFSTAHEQTCRLSEEPRDWKRRGVI